MAIEVNSPEYFMIFGFTIMVLAVKLLMSGYMLRNIMKRRKEGQMVSTWFLWAFFILIFCLFISRVFYVLFDFYFTKFDMTTYYVYPNYWYWKMGNFFAGFGLIYMVFALDRRLLQFKLKGIIEIFMAGGLIAVMIYPIETMDDFNFVSVLYVIPLFGIVVLPLIFIKIARESTGDLRKISFSIIIGIILYTIASFAVNAAIVTALNEATSRSMDVLLYLIQTLLKMIGIVLLAYGASKFQF